MFVIKVKIRFFGLLIVFVSLALIGVSCSKEVEHELRLFKADVINYKYLFTKEKHVIENPVNRKAQFKYIGNKVVARYGGSIPIAGSGGAYSEGIYDTVQYVSPTQITIFCKDNLLGLDVYPFQRDIKIENGLVTKKVTYEVPPGDNGDTMYYYYDTKRKLVKTIQFFKYQMIRRQFYYDNNSNLQSIKGSRVSRIDNATFDLTEETFSGYDKNPNPLKGECLWPDILYWTLSTNNFTHYTYKSYYLEETRNWNLTYDGNGFPDFSK